VRQLTTTKRRGQVHKVETAIPLYDSSALGIPAFFEFRELLKYRYLVRNLISRDLKVRYKRSVLGFVWVMLNPLLMSLVLTVVFSHILRFSIQHYSVFLLGGILVWNVFAQGSVAAMSNLVSNAGTLRRIYIPASVFVASSIGSALVNLIFALVPFFIVALVTGVQPQLTWPFIIVPCFLAGVFSFGIGLIVSTLMVYFNDTYEIYTVLITALTYLTPIYYPVTFLPEPFRSAEQFNPMFLNISIFQQAVLQGTLPSSQTLFMAFGMSFGVLLIGWLFFTKMEGSFAYHF